MYNPHNTCHTRYYVESKKYGVLLLETFFSTQGNMKKRGPDGNAKSSAAVGAGVVEVVDDTEGQGRGETEDSTNNSKKARITSVRELGKTSKPPTKITQKKARSG